MNACVLVGAADFFPELFRVRKRDFLIACDGGLASLDRIGVTPDLIVGDFDSYGSQPETDVPVITLPVEKDDTDMLYAAKEGLKRGYKKFFIHGGLCGDRPSHTIANLALLSYLLDQGAEGFLFGKNSMFFACDPGKHTLRRVDGYLSLFAFGGPCRITLSGAKYPFDGILDSSHPIGVSNAFEKEEVRLTVRGGRVLCVIESENLPRYSKHF